MRRGRERAREREWFVRKDFSFYLGAVFSPLDLSPLKYNNIQFISVHATLRALDEDDEEEEKEQDDYYDDVVCIFMYVCICTRVSIKRELNQLIHTHKHTK